MDIETYQNGELVESRAIDESIAQSPDVANFINQMMQNQAYNQMVFAQNLILISRLELAVTTLNLKAEITTEDLATIKELWDIIVSLTDSNQLTLDRLDELNQAAIFNRMPFAFDNNFQMVLSL